MKKSILLCFLFITILSLNMIHAEILGNITSWRADKIEGYVCNTDNPEVNYPVNLIFRDKYNENPTWQESTLLTANLTYDGTEERCHGEHGFSYSVYSNPTQLENIFSQFPVTITGSSTGISDLTHGLTLSLDFSCSNPNQTIMQLHKPKNSHIYMWNSTALDDPYSICYDQIFGFAFEGNFHPSCNTNSFIWKVQKDNSHASVQSSVDYPEKVCYGDLICINKAGNCLVSEGKSIIKLYYSNNSHVSYFNDSSYNLNICCKTFLTPNPITSAKWRNMDDVEINYANLSDNVKLSLTGGTTPETDLTNKWINYSIYNSSNALAFSIQKQAESNNPSVIWETKSGTYTFTATLVENPLLTKTSGVLSVSNEYGPDDFDIEIEKPKCAENFTINSPVEFVIKVTTTNQLVLLNLSFGDNNYAILNNSISNRLSLNHYYNSDGAKNIILQATNFKNTVNKRRMINIILINESKSGIYLAACIDSPEDMSNINTQKVICNASSSKAINYTSSPKNYRFIDINLIHFNWTFSDGSLHHFVGVLSGVQSAECSGSGNYDTKHDYINPSGEPYNHTIPCPTTTKGYSFTKYFALAGKNKADLIVSI